MRLFKSAELFLIIRSVAIQPKYKIDLIEHNHVSLEITYLSESYQNIRNIDDWIFKVCFKLHVSDDLDGFPSRPTSFSHTQFINGSQSMYNRIKDLQTIDG